MSLKHNKAFKRDSCRVAFWVCREFGGESALQKLGLCGTHPLTRRYTKCPKLPLFLVLVAFGSVF
ncbi:DUF3265 domain-containing protein [Vibrio vulnificus]|nr:DUF3265 domain-containing protein [Vibrio vulnificus]